jgi:hypothetical protein
MKIVDRTTFLASPPGTLFSTYVPYCFGDLCIKGETLDGDTWYQTLSDELCLRDGWDADREEALLDHALKTGASLPLMFSRETRDGALDEKSLFAVWEPEDVQKLIERLQQALAQVTAAPA